MKGCLAVKDIEWEFDSPEEEKDSNLPEKVILDFDTVRKMFEIVIDDNTISTNIFLEAHGINENTPSEEIMSELKASDESGYGMSAVCDFVCEYLSDNYGYLLSGFEYVDDYDEIEEEMER